ncbi:glycine cleavage T C-terminal barrel domain-containing protein [Paracoccus sp. (in: a-proteobacteria)]|uniref:glycine cleavage T C-terminal barrel domain-containing protein n=1 Tax=Paracoccus sp. TaxID=267 RepID=UPI0039C9B4E3
MLRKRKAGLTRGLIQCRQHDPEPLLFHHAPVLHDGKIVGFPTSGNYGHTLRGLAWLSAVPEGRVHTQDPRASPVRSAEASLTSYDLGSLRVHAWRSLLHWETVPPLWEHPDPPTVPAEEVFICKPSFCTMPMARRPMP